MTSPAHQSRIERHRMEGLAKPPRLQWRLLGMLPLLALALLVATWATMAWFTDAKPLAAPLATGQWSTLMTDVTPDPLVITGGATSGSVTTRNQSNWNLDFRYEWAPGTVGGGAITVVDVDNNNQPLVGGILPSGHTARITVSGSWSDSWSGTLRLSIGSNYFDERRPAVSVTVTKVPDIVTISGVCFFGSGQAAPQNRWVSVLSAVQKANLPPALQGKTLIVTRTAYANYLGDPAQFEAPAVKASASEPTTPPTVDMSTDTWINQANMQIWSGTSMTPKYYPTTVELTVTAQDPSIKGLMKLYYVIGQSSDINAITDKKLNIQCPTSLVTFEVQQQGNKVIIHQPGETAPARPLAAPQLQADSLLTPDISAPNATDSGAPATDESSPPTPDESGTPATGDSTLSPDNPPSNTDAATPDSSSDGNQLPDAATPQGVAE